MIRIENKDIPNIKGLILETNSKGDVDAVSYMGDNYNFYTYSNDMNLYREGLDSLNGRDQVSVPSNDEEYREYLEWILKCTNFETRESKKIHKELSMYYG